MGLHKWAQVLRSSKWQKNRVEKNRVREQLILRLEKPGQEKPGQRAINTKIAKEKPGQRAINTKIAMGYMILSLKITGIDYKELYHAKEAQI